MEPSITLAVATTDQRLFARIESLTRGSHIAVLGTALLNEKAIQQMAERQLGVVIFDGRSAEQDYLPFIQRLLAACPSTKCVVFGNSVDVAVMARAVATGVRGYLPTIISYPDFVESISDIVAGRTPTVESAFTRTAKAMAIPRRAGGSEASSGRATSATRKAASQCLNLGLTVSETARYLGMPEEQVKRCVTRTTIMGSIPRLLTNRGLLYGVALASCFWTILQVSGMNASDIPTTEPLSGHVQYEDGSPLPVAVCELTFHSMAAPTQGRNRVGRAVVEGHKGEFRTVCYDAKYPGLPAGEYKVTVRLPGQVTLPSFIAAEEYGDPAKTPLTIDTAMERVILKVKRPKALMERFDRDANGSLEAVERATVREAVGEGDAVKGGRE